MNRRDLFKRSAQGAAVAAVGAVVLPRVVDHVPTAQERPAVAPVKPNKLYELARQKIVAGDELWTGGTMPVHTGYSTGSHAHMESRHFIADYWRADRPAKIGDLVRFDQEGGLTFAKSSSKAIGHVVEVGWMTNDAGLVQPIVTVVMS
jgi:hypothetical protein